MQKTINLMPGYKVNEYLLVLVPHTELWNKIRKIKEEFSLAFETSRWGKPHVALVSFTQFEMMEERILNRIKTIAMGQYPFKVELKDFGSFPSHTIYINVTSKMPIQNLVKTIRHDTQKLMKLDDDHKPHFMLEPFITIARRLQPWQYEKGWLEYSNRNFSGRFIADSLLVLKRPMGEMNYQVAGRFAFQNLPVITKQGALFA